MRLHLRAHGNDTFCDVLYIKLLMVSDRFRVDTFNALSGAFNLFVYSVSLFRPLDDARRLYVLPLTYLFLVFFLLLNAKSPSSLSTPQLRRAPNGLIYFLKFSLEFNFCSHHNWQMHESTALLLLLAFNI